MLKQRRASRCSRRRRRSALAAVCHARSASARASAAILPVENERNGSSRQERHEASPKGTASL